MLSKLLLRSLRSQHEFDSDRREFLQQLALGAGALTIPGCFNATKSKNNVAIIGAGLSGLRAGLELKQAGMDFTIFEVTSREGGRVMTSNLFANNPPVELGAEAIDGHHSDIIELCKKYDLKLTDRKAQEYEHLKPSFYIDGKVLSEQDVIALYHPFAERISYDINLINKSQDNENILDKIPASVYMEKIGMSGPIKTIIGKILKGFYGIPPERQSTLQLLWLFPGIEGERFHISLESDEKYSIAGGNHLLPQKMASELHDHIKKYSNLQKIKKRGSNFELTINDKTHEFGKVIVAVPFSVLRDIPIEAKLPSRLREMIKSLDYGQANKIIAQYSAPVWRSKSLSGDIICDGPAHLIWDANAGVEGNKGALTFFCMDDEKFSFAKVNLKDELANLHKHLNAIDSSIPSSYTGKMAAFNWSQNPFSKGCYSSFKPGQYAQFKEFLYSSKVSSVGESGLYFAGEHLSNAYGGYMNGAIQTGRLAGKALLSQL